MDERLSGLTMVALKRFCREVDQRAASDQPVLLSVSIHHGVVPRSQLTEDEPRADHLGNYKLCDCGDLVLNRMRAFQGAIGVSNQRGMVSPDYLVLRPTRDVLGAYLHYAFRSEWFVGQMTSRIRGIGSVELGSVRTPRINASDLLEIDVELPSVSMQRRIADFLDNQVARIDNLASTRSKQGDLISEYLQSMVQAEWQLLVSRYGTIRSGYRLLGMEQGWSPETEAREADETEWAVMRAGCANGGDFNEADHKALPSHLSPRREYEIRAGDLLMSRASGSPDLIGSVAVVPAGVRPRLLLPDKIYRLTPDPSRIDKSFMAAMLRSPAARKDIKSGISGAEGMANNLPSSVIRSIRIPCVPREDQAGVAANIGRLEQQAARGHALLQASCDRLIELKRSLVTSAVMGEFDVSSADGSQVPI